MGASPRKPDARPQSKWALKFRDAQPEGCVNPETRDGAHKQKRAHDRGARPKGCFTQKPDAPHENTWALKIRGAQPDGGVKPGTRGGAHNQKRAHDRGARPRRVLHPATRHAAQEKVGTKEKGAHNPTGALNPEHGAARTTKGVCPTGEHFR